ncbi:MAG: hypothetical protein MKZ70_12680 [Opitutales bacterium]|nr:hypothetical protein [Opitutales bacterium]
MLGLAGALVVHAVKVWVFAYAFYFMHHAEGWGQLKRKFGRNPSRLRVRVLKANTSLH